MTIGTVTTIIIIIMIIIIDTIYNNKYNDNINISSNKHSNNDIVIIARVVTMRIVLLTEGFTNVLLSFSWCLVLFLAGMFWAHHALSVLRDTWQIETLSPKP